MFRTELRTFWPPIETWRLVRDIGDIVAGQVSNGDFHWKSIDFWGSTVTWEQYKRQFVKLWAILERDKLIPAKLVVGGRAIYRPATIFVVVAGTIPALVPATWWLTSIGHALEKVLLAGVKLYADLHHQHLLQWYLLSRYWPINGVGHLNVLRDLFYLVIRINNWVLLLRNHAKLSLIHIWRCRRRG